MAKSTRDELLAALQKAENRVAELRDLLGLPLAAWTVKTQAEVATFFGVSTHTVDAWRRTAPVGLPGNRGNYSLQACFEWWLIHGPGRRGKGRPPKSAGDEYDPLMDVQDDTPALERWRLARAMDAEISLAERKQQIVSVELFRRMLDAAFAPLRQFAEEQIKAHGNGTGEAWTEAVEQFEQEVESVIGRPGNDDGAKGIAEGSGPANSATLDAAD